MQELRDPRAPGKPAAVLHLVTGPWRKLAEAHTLAAAAHAGDPVAALGALHAAQIAHAGIDRMALAGTVDLRLGFGATRQAHVLALAMRGCLRRLRAPGVKRCLVRAPAFLRALPAANG
jgi:hypothetical protein